MSPRPTDRRPRPTPFITGKPVNGREPVVPEPELDEPPEENELPDPVEPLAPVDPVDDPLEAAAEVPAMVVEVLVEAEPTEVVVVAPATVVVVADWPAVVVVVVADAPLGPPGTWDQVKPLASSALAEKVTSVFQ
jgi:hypothetical protein